jgi:hypothetical protein
MKKKRSTKRTDFGRLLPSWDGHWSRKGDWLIYDEVTNFGPEQWDAASKAIARTNGLPDGWHIVRAGEP